MVVTKGLGAASATAATGGPVGSSGVVLCDVTTGRASSTPREQTAAGMAANSLRHEIRCMSGQFVDNDGHRRSTQRLSMAVWVQCGSARGLIPPLAGMAAEVFAARRGQRSPPAGNQ